MNPRMRSGHNVIHFERGVSVFGSMTFGIGQEVSDPDGKLLQLNDLLDGSRTYDEVIPLIATALRIPASDVESFMSRLIDNGHIEDASQGTTLSQREQERYSRQAHYLSRIRKDAELGHWTPTEILRKSHVTVLGIGGIGGAIATHLTAAGIGRITIVDHDVVELSNLNRQYLFSESSVGRSKVVEAGARLRQLNSSCEIEVVDEVVAGVDDVVTRMATADLFFRAADTPDQMPYWVSDAALATGTAWIDCSYAGPVVNFCTYVPGLTGCYRCMRESEYARMAATGRSTAFSDQAPDVNAALGPVVHVAGAMAAYEGIRFLTGLGAESIGRGIHQNMFRYDHSYVIEVPEECTHGTR